MRIAAVVLALVLTAVGAWYGGAYVERTRQQTGDTQPDAPEVSATDDATGGTATVSPVAAGEIPDSGDVTRPPREQHINPPERERIRTAIAFNEHNLESIEELEAYLQSLEARAGQRGKVTAMEVEPGIAAIRQFAAELGEEQVIEKQAAFTRRMRERSRMLTTTEEVQHPDVYYAEIISADDEQAKQAAIDRYLRAAANLPPQEHQYAVRQLETLLETHSTTPQFEQKLSQLRHRIADAPDEASRQQYIREYLEVSHHLSPEAQQEADRWLNNVDW